MLSSTLGEMKPKLTPELAEIVGIMFGDGYMKNKHNHAHVIRIFGNLSKDRVYMHYIKRMFIRNFNIVPKLSEYPKKNYLELYVYSKELVDYFHRFLLIPLSPKTNLSIPEYIKEDEQLLISFIRGLFDTDGCVTHQIDRKNGRKYYYVLIKISAKSESFTREIVTSLKKLGIKSFCCEKIWRGNKGYDVVVRHKNTISFFELIGSNNPRNKVKWEQEWGRWDSNF